MQYTITYIVGKKLKWHARPHGYWQALCGISPGQRPAKWSEEEGELEHLSCRKCRHEIRANETLRTAYPPFKS